MNEYNLSENGLFDTLLKESLRIPDGWHEEVYYNKDTNELSFSSPLTSNSWTRSTDIVGTIESFDFSDIEGWKTIDNNFVEVDDYENETDPSFKDKEYERYYTDSSIITMDDAIDRFSSNDDEMFQDIAEEIEKINPDYWK